MLKNGKLRNVKENQTIRLLNLLLDQRFLRTNTKVLQHQEKWKGKKESGTMGNINIRVVGI